MPFFALSDADRASELRADTEAILAASRDRRAVLLPFVAGRALVVAVDEDGSRPGVRFAPAEVRLRTCGARPTATATATRATRTRSLSRGCPSWGSGRKTERRCSRRR